MRGQTGHRWRNLVIAATALFAAVMIAPNVLAGKLWKWRSASVDHIVKAADEHLATAVRLKQGDDEHGAQALAHRARLQYEKALRLSPGNVELHYRAFLCVANYYDTRIKVEWESALYHADRIRALDPFDLRDVSITGALPHILGKALLLHTVPDESKLYRRIVTEYERWFAYIDSGFANSIVANAHSNVAEIYMALGDLEQAIKHYKVGTKTSGDRPELPYYGLALAYERNGQRAFAREAMRRALLFNPELSSLKGADRNTGVYFVPRNDKYAYLALAYDVKGQLARAAYHYKEFLDRAPRVRKEYRAVAKKRLEALKRQGVKIRKTKFATPDGYRR